MLFIQYLAIFTGVATATTFTAWNGQGCTGAQGSSPTVSGSGSCEAVGGRTSWRASGDNVKGYYYSGNGCTGTRSYFTGNNNQCYNINTGYYVASMCVIGAGGKGCGL